MGILFFKAIVETFRLWPKRRQGFNKNGAIFIKPVFKKDIEKYKNNMVRTFQKSGGSFGIYFPIELIEILEINPSVDFLSVEIDENILVIKKYLENGNI